MRLYSVRLVAAVALFAYVEASALESQPQPTLPETSGHGHTSDQTFPQNGTNTDEEERMNSSNGLRVVEEAVRNNLPKEAKQWMKELKGKSAQEAFEYLCLDKAGDKLFAKSGFLQWEYFDTSAQGEDTYKAMVKVLLDHFGITRLAKMLDAAKKSDRTKAIAIKLENAFFSSRQGSNLSNTFHDFMLKATSDDLLGTPLFKLWYNYAMQKWSPENVMIFLTARINNFRFAEMLDVAKTADGTKAIAIELENALIVSWQRYTPEYMFDELGIEVKSVDLLGIPLFKIWYQFAKQKGSPLKVAMFLEARLKRFGLFKMLDAAKEGDSTKAIAIELEDAYISRWQHSNPGIMFDELGLEAKSDDLLGNPLFKTWYKFAMKKEWADLEVVIFLEARLNEDGLVKMLDAAKETDSTKAIAIALEYAYIHQRQYYVPGSIFDNLGLKAKSNDLLGNPLFKTWYKYATEDWPPLKVVEYLKGESNGFGLAVMLDAATKVEDTEAIAIELLEALFGHWRRINLSKAAADEELWLTQPLFLARKMDLGQTVSADDFSVWRKYTEWRKKKGILETATDSAHAL